LKTKKAKPLHLVGILKCSLEESAANARLIAAAPDMLAECEAALQFVIERLREECAMWQATAEATQQFVDTHERVRGLRAVIAKAKVCNER
jgi:hypothetical protein